MKVAVVHEWLTVYGGSERVLEDILSLYPDATLYALVYDKDRMPERFRNYHIVTTKMQHWFRATKWYKKYLAFMPAAYEALDLTEYDLVISSSTCCAKGVLTGVDTPHICYCHTPTRYEWDMYYEYYRNASPLTRLFMPGMIRKLRLWDYAAAQRVDYFVSNSDYIARRIRKYYRRDAKTIHPGVRMYRGPIQEPDDFYLVLSRFVPYKRVDLAVEACTKLGKRLVVIGGGEEEKRLRRLAGPTVEFKGFLNDREVAEILPHAKAFLFPGVEDFGITPVEAQTCGVPVIAYAAGGALETVEDGRTGLFFHEQEVDALCEAIGKFEREGVALSRAEIHENAEKFSQERFRREFRAYVDACMADWKSR